VTLAHTPGPWRLWLAEDDRGAFTLKGDSPEPHGADMLIVQRNIGTPNGDEGVANAFLIAAAPILLAAARLAVEVIGNTRDELGLKLEAEKAYLALRAAIAKAEAE
jgi:hypothetical protein